MEIPASLDVVSSMIETMGILSPNNIPMLVSIWTWSRELVASLYFLSSIRKMNSFQRYIVHIPSEPLHDMMLKVLLGLSLKIH